MIVWIIINVVVAIYMAIILSSYIRNEIKKNIKNNHSTKDGIIFFFKVDMLVSYATFSFAPAAIIFIISLGIDRLVETISGNHSLDIVPYTVWPVFFLYMLIALVVSVVVINFHLRDCRDKYDAMTVKN